MLNKIKKFIPKPIISLYHKTLAILANFVYRSPSDKLIVIGITGTSGKSTVVYLITKLLEQAGFRVGAASTILFKVGKKEWLNDKKMTMVGRLALQKLISRMAKANCQYAVIETTSQGIEQFRHFKINYDILIFTNLYPEHIEAHGGFENYKNAKLKLFSGLKDNPAKIIAGQTVPKTIIANLDDKYWADFLNNEATVKYGFTLNNNFVADITVVAAQAVNLSGQGSEFKINEVPFKLKLLGQHNIYNATATVALGLNQGLSLEKMSEILAEMENIPGRLEFINENQPFTVIVDYAFEPQAVEKLYGVVKLLPHQKIIHVLGSAGGGRDIARRPKLGELAGHTADYVVVTNEDPYDDDPQEIIDQVAHGAKMVGKVLNQNLFTILDRRQAMAQALRLAQPNDLVLITGKGSEQAMVIKNNKKIPWDDREVAREELRKLKVSKS